MPRINTAYVSAYQLDRVKQTDLYANAKVTLTCNWGGVLDGRTISSVTWFTDSPWSTVLSSPAITNKLTTVNLQAALPGESILKCEATLSDGSVVNQLWRVNVPMTPMQGQPVAQGPESVSA